MTSAVTQLDASTFLSAIEQAVEAHGPDMLAVGAGALAGVAVFGAVVALLSLWRRSRASAPSSVRSTVVTIPPYSVRSPLKPVFPPSRVPATILCDETGPASAVTVAALPTGELV